MLRVGHGYDVHAFGVGDHIVVGGVILPFGKGIVAHSDGDVLIHALCDALLGAAGLGDIGRHFPDSDPAYQGIDSRLLLRRVVELLQDQGWRLGNADLTIVAQAPKMAPYIDTMGAHLAVDLGCSRDCINIKATTTEKLGFIGNGEGLACYAVVLLEQR
jgi:2-C-methyl-D-erythritol 2,4-cyclodiphosphate synthase